MTTLADILAVFSYCPETGELRWAVDYRVGRTGEIAGSIDANGYRRVQYKCRTYKVHRLAWLFVHGEWPAHDIDHINGNRADNRIANLRLASKAQNAQNYLRRETSSGFQGVCWNKRHKKWRAHIRANRCQHYLGSFDTPEAAHSAYLSAKRNLHEFQPVPRDLCEASL